MKTLTVYQVDAFTQEKFRGNPAGVVTNADDLTEEEMQNIARELNNSETAFIFSPDGPGHEVRIRFFTPKAEVPVCGHATISAHYVRAVERSLASSILFHKIGIGTLPVEIIKNHGNYSVMMTQGRIEFMPPLCEDIVHEVLRGLRLSADDLDPRGPIQIVSTGHSKVMIPVVSRDTLDSLTPDMAVLAELSRLIQCNGYFVFKINDMPDDRLSGTVIPSETVLSHGRMFAPAIGINEDPVTGNANGPLGPYLIKHGFVQPQGSLFTFYGEQGNALGRSGLVRVEVSLEAGQPYQVRVGGHAVIVFKTEITI